MECQLELSHELPNGKTSTIESYKVFTLARRHAKKLGRFLTVLAELLWFRAMFSSMSLFLQPRERYDDRNFNYGVVTLLAI